jgi:hypothetical protein
MEISPFDVQQQVIEQRLVSAMAAAPAGTKRQIAALRRKAEEALAQADESEAKQVQACALLASLKLDRSNAAADLGELRQLEGGLGTIGEAARGLVLRWLGSNRGNDVNGQRNFATGLDALCRLQLLAPVLPTLISEKEAALSLINDQIKGMDSQQ